MNILNKEMYTKILHEYYLTHYGEKETDIWYEQPAVLFLWYWRAYGICKQIQQKKYLI